MHTTTTQHPLRKHTLATRTLVELGVRQVVLKQPAAKVGQWLGRQLEVMGPTYIKLGQFISTRDDIFGKEFVGGLTNLRDRVQPMPPSQSRQVLGAVKARIPDIEWIELDPIGVASIGQVHKARTRDGTYLAIKVQRPGVRDEIRADISFMKAVVGVAGRLTGRGGGTHEASDALGAMENALEKELDYMSECANMQDFARAYGTAFRDTLAIPRAFPQWSNSETLIMEYLPGYGTPAGQPGKALAVKIMTIFIRQLIEYGLLHGDPHPGNIGFTKDGRLILYDYGCVVRIPKRTRLVIKELVYTLVLGNKYDVVASLPRIGIVVDDKKRALDMVDGYIGYMRTLDTDILKSLLLQSKDEIPMRLDANASRILRVYGMLEGLCKKLDPTFNYFDLADSVAFDLLADEDFVYYKVNRDMRRLSAGWQEPLFKLFDDE